MGVDFLTVTMQPILTLYRWRVRKLYEFSKKRIPFIPNPLAVLVRLNPLGNNCLSNSIPLVAARYQPSRGQQSIDASRCSWQWGPITCPLSS